MSLPTDHDFEKREGKRGKTEKRNKARFYSRQIHNTEKTTYSLIKISYEQPEKFNLHGDLLEYINIDQKISYHCVNLCLSICHPPNIFLVAPAVVSVLPK